VRRSNEGTELLAHPHIRTLIDSELLLGSTKGELVGLLYLGCLGTVEDEGIHIWQSEYPDDQAQQSQKEQQRLIPS